MAKVNGWLIALIIVVIIIIILIIIAAVYSAPGSCNTVNIKNKISHRQVEVSMSCSNLTLTLVNLSNHISNFLCQSKSGFKYLPITYSTVCEHIDKAHDDLVVITNNRDMKFKEYIREKHEIYKDIVEETIINKNGIESCKHLLNHLNERNVLIANELCQCNEKIEKKECIKLLHQYDLYLVGQIASLSNGDYKNFLTLCDNATMIYIKFVVLIKKSYA